jgi:hypothetical protein
MPVTTTDTPDLLRVSFPIVESGKGIPLSTEVDIVCFLRLNKSSPGFQILYAYHILRTRSGSIGPFEQESRKQFPLTRALVATIEHCVKEEYWTCFATSVTHLPFTDSKIGEMSDEELEVNAATTRA